MSKHHSAKYQVVNHILKGARVEVSPYFNERPLNSTGQPCDVSLLVIHNISLPAGQFNLPYIEELFLGCLDCSVDPSFSDLEGLEVSTHLLIRRSGEVVQFVPFDKRAWHAGVSSFQGVDNCNDYSIGIELEGTDDLPYTKQQYTHLIQVTHAILSAYPNIKLERICGHNDIAPGRKTDPGQAFDWSHYLKLISVT